VGIDENVDVVESFWVYRFPTVGSTSSGRGIALLLIAPILTVVVNRWSALAFLAATLELAALWAIFRPLRLRVGPTSVSIVSPLRRRTIVVSDHDGVILHRTRWTTTVTVKATRVYLHQSRWDECIAVLNSSERSG
jgi:hypothetical protein